MKIRNLGKPDYASIEDRRSAGKSSPGFADSLKKAPRSSAPRSYAPKQETDWDAVGGAIVSAQKALRRMGNQPLPSRMPPKGNNPGSVAQMKFPRLSRSK